MAFGLGTLRLAPDAFWAATPREIAAAMPGVFAGPAVSCDPPGRDAVAALLAAFPDEDLPSP